MSTTAPHGRIVTFYSYKGGTGRTLLLANVGWILASAGKRVLAIDWDLEAPGLHHYFHPFLIDPSLAASDGLIDMVENFADASVTAEDEVDRQQAWLQRATDIRRFAVGLDWDFPEPGGLDFVPAGRQNSAYSVRVNTFDWRHFYEELGGGAFLEHLKDKLRSKYDYVLIDSRTGASDTSGICTVQMPDRLVVCFTANEQSIRGAAAVAESVRSQWSQQETSGTNLKGDSNEHIDRRIYPILTRVETGEKDKLDAARTHVRELFDPIVEKMTGRRPEDYWRRAQILYWPYYAYEEVLAIFGDKSSHEGSLLAACETVAGFLTDDQVVHLEPLSFANRERVLAVYERKQRDRPPDAIMLVAPRDWRDAEQPLEELRGEMGLRILARDWNEWFESGLSDETTSSPPLILAIGAEASRVASPKMMEALNRAAASGARLYPLLLANAPTEDDALPDIVCEHQWIDLRRNRDVGEALIPLEFAIRENQSVNESDPRLSQRRLMRRLIMQATEWLEKDRDESYLLHGTQLDETLKWIERSEQTLEPIGRDFIETSRIRRDEAAVAGSLRGAEETAAKAQAQFEQAEASRIEAMEKLAVAERALREVDQEQALATERLKVADQLRKKAWSLSRNLALAASVLVVIGIAVGVYQYSAIRTARMEIERARKASTERLVEFLAAESGNRLHARPQLATLLATEAVMRSENVAATPTASAVTALGNALRVIAGRPLRGDEGPVTSAAFSPDGTRVITTSVDGTARLWDAVSGKGIAVFHGQQGRVLSAAFSPDGARVVTASGDQAARLWDAVSGDEIAVFHGHEGRVLSAALSPDGARVVTASVDGTARLWDAVSGKEIAVFHGHEGDITSAAFSPDGTRVITTSVDGTARLWDAVSGKEIAVFHGHEGRVLSAAFSTAGARAVTASGDRTARLWDVVSAKEIAVFHGHEGGVSSAAFSPDGAQLVTASEDWTARLWRVSDRTNEYKLDPNEEAPPGETRSNGLLPAEMIDRAREVVARNMTLSEWTSFFRSDIYCKTFPSLPVPIRDQVQGVFDDAEFIKSAEGRDCLAEKVAGSRPSVKS